MVYWKPILDFPGYSISSCGQVKNSEGQILKPCDSKGYRQLTLYRKGRRKKSKVHHLVLFAFGPPRPPGTECNHLNGKRADNRIANLEWVTPSENRIHAYHTLKGHKLLKLTAEDVLAIRKDPRTQCALAKVYGVHFTTISEICLRKTWKHI